MCKSQNKTRNMLLATWACLGGLVAALLAPAPAAYAQDKTFTMKLSTATINDTQHEWLKRFAALVEKDSGGRIKAEIYPASQLGSIPRQIEGVQFGSIQGWMGPPEFLVGVDERFEALSAPGLFSSVDQVMKVIAGPADPEDDVRARRAEGPDRRRLRADRAVVDPVRKKPVTQAGRPQGHEDPRAGVAVPARADPPHGRLADRDDARRRAAGPSAGHHRRHADDHDDLHHDAVLRRRQVRDQDRPALREFDRRDEQEVDGHAAARSAEGRPRRRRQGHRGDHAVREGVLRRADQDLDAPRAARSSTCRRPSTTR